jgi:integration host factor subunit beta
MTRTDLISELSRVLGISAQESEDMVGTVYLSIIGSLQAGETVDIRGFGRFMTRPRRRGSPPARVPYFRPSKQLKQFIRTHGSPAPAAGSEGSR